jgi:hypothetical protein
MRVLAKVFRPFHQAAVAFFSHDLTLRRSREGLKVVLQARAPAAHAVLGAREQARLAKEKAELELMLSELDELLDQQPGSRQTLRHIEYVRQSLRKKGLRALHKLPVDVLQRALEQFESLVSNWTPVGLASLRSKMAVAVIDREHINPDAEADAYRTTAVLDNLPGIPSLPEVEVHCDDDALAEAYAALAGAAPVGPAEFQADLGARSAKAVAAKPPRSDGQPAELELRALES